MENLKDCLICGHNSATTYKECIDNTVSKTKFSIVECEGCGFKYTNPRPPLSEIGKYYKAENYISHTDTDKGLISKLYKMVRNYSVAQKFNLVNRASNGKTLLDYGCGTGFFLNYCKEKNWNTTGLEPDIDARTIAIKRSNLDVISLDQFKTLNQGSFDVITMWHVLEHVHDLNETIAQLKQLLTKKGKLIIAVPNPDSHDAKVYSEHWAAYDLPRHLYHFVPKTIDQLLTKHGFNLKETHPMRFDSFYVSMLSEKYRGTNSLVKAFTNGFISNMKASSSGQYSSLIYVFEVK